MTNKYEITLDKSELGIIKEALEDLAQTWKDIASDEKPEDERSLKEYSELILGISLKLSKFTDMVVLEAKVSEVRCYPAIEGSEK